MVPVPKSETPLVPDTLPALKVRHYVGGIAPRRHIYSFARLYMLGDALSLALYCFEREPEPTSRIAFAFCAAAQNARCVTLELAPQRAGGSRAYALAPGTPLPAAQGHALAAPPPAYFAGVDEQGWYWGAGLLLPPALVQTCGSALNVGAEFYAAVLKYDEGKEGLGASFSPPQNAPPVITGAQKFAVVIY